MQEKSCKNDLLLISAVALPLIAFIIYAFTNPSGHGWWDLLTGTITGLCVLPAFLILGISIQDKHFIRVKTDAYLLSASTFGTIYCIGLIIYFTGTISENAITGSIATVLVTPHILCASLATIFTIIGCCLKKFGLALTGAILYAVAAIIFLLYGWLIIPAIVLSFIGTFKIRKATITHNEISIDS